MRLQAFYELGNGQEAQREFQYLKLQTDKEFTNGRIITRRNQQLDEFEIAEYWICTVHQSLHEHRKIHSFQQKKVATFAFGESLYCLQF
jgi:hypothetical protein